MSNLHVKVPRISILEVGYCAPSRLRSARSGYKSIKAKYGKIQVSKKFLCLNNILRTLSIQYLEMANNYTYSVIPYSHSSSNQNTRLCTKRTKSTDAQPVSILSTPDMYERFPSKGNSFTEYSAFLCNPSMLSHICTSPTS